MQKAYLMPGKGRTNLRREDLDNKLYVSIHPQVYNYTLYVGQAIQIEVEFNGEFLRRVSNPEGIVQFDKITIDVDNVLKAISKRRKLQRDLAIMYENSQDLKKLEKNASKR